MSARDRIAARLANADALAGLEAERARGNDLSAWRKLLDRVVLARMGQVTRDDTTPKDLFTVPAGSDLLAVLVWSPAGSNAIGSAAIALGRPGQPQWLLDALNVAGPSGAGQILPPIKRHGNTPEDVTVTGTYAETGVPSTAGGPWTVVAFLTRI